MNTIRRKAAVFGNMAIVPDWNGDSENPGGIGLHIIKTGSIFPLPRNGPAAVN
jgi:hypothetical protein